jgi:hypothetical protein
MTNKTCEWITNCWRAVADEQLTDVELCGEPATMRVSGKWFCAVHAEKMNDAWQKVDYSDPPNERCGCCGWHYLFCACAENHDGCQVKP